MTKRYKGKNGWNEQEMLQFAVNAIPYTKVMLMFLEDKVIDWERENKWDVFFRKIP